MRRQLCLGLALEAERYLGVDRLSWWEGGGLDWIWSS